MVCIELTSCFLLDDPESHWSIFLKSWTVPECEWALSPYYRLLPSNFHRLESELWFPVFPDFPIVYRHPCRSLSLSQSVCVHMLEHCLSTLPLFPAVPSVEDCRCWMLDEDPMSVGAADSVLHPQLPWCLAWSSGPNLILLTWCLIFHLIALCLLTLGLSLQ